MSHHVHSFRAKPPYTRVIASASSEMDLDLDLGVVGVEQQQLSGRAGFKAWAVSGCCFSSASLSGCSYVASISRRPRLQARLPVRWLCNQSASSEDPRSGLQHRPSYLSLSRPASSGSAKESQQPTGPYRGFPSWKSSGVILKLPNARESLAGREVLPNTASSGSSRRLDHSRRLTTALPLPDSELTTAAWPDLLLHRPLAMGTRLLYRDA